MTNRTLTPQEKKKFGSKKWRLENIYYITNKQKKRVKFKLNKVQLVLLACAERFIAVLKARQLGVSTYFLLYYLDEACFNKNKTVCILAHEQDAIKKLFRIVRYAYENMHDDIKPTIDRGGGSKYELYFPEINSRIYCDLESRSDTISDLHISEYAFVKDTQKVLATMDAVPIETGKISIETTPFGLNFFYRNWKDKLWPFKKLFFPWFFLREYKLSTIPIDNLTEEEIKLKETAKEVYGIDLADKEIAFRRFKIKQKNKQHFLQEYAEDDISCFLMSGSPVIDKFLIQKLLDKITPPIEIFEGLNVYEKPVNGVRYVVGADTAEGVGSDYSVACVMRSDTMTQVALYRAHIKPFDFAYRLIKIAEYYKVNGIDEFIDGETPINIYPTLAVERNNHGHAVIGKLIEEKYPNIYRAKDEREGWLTNKVTRPVMIDTFVDGVESFEITLKDKDTLEECTTLVDNKGKIEAEKGCHDDCVIATSIAVRVSMKKPKERKIRITGL